MKRAHASAAGAPFGPQRWSTLESPCEAGHLTAADTSAPLQSSEARGAQGEMLEPLSIVARMDLCCAMRGSIETLNTQTTLVDLCRSHADRHGTDLVYRFWLGDGTFTTLTFGELDRAACRQAAHLREHCVTGDRVVLLFAPGLEFIAAFVGCLYAGLIAVPVSPPRGEARLAKLQAISRDCDARAVLCGPHLTPDFATLGSVFDGERRTVAFYQDLTALSDEHFIPVAIDASRPAFLQYTSGSTGSPKGVVVTHANLMANSATMQHRFQLDRTSVIVSWLPLFHDMGLVGSMIQPLYGGSSAVLMPPSAFVRRPARWLRLISEHGGTCSGGPNFAYDMCTRRIRDDELAGVDLSSWRVAFNGAEPIRASTLEAFSERFSRNGFARKSFFPCYGLAEATLFVVGSIPGVEPTVKHVSAQALERNHTTATSSTRLRALVGCGYLHDDELRVRIVDFAHARALGEGEVGEICVSGPSVAAGYWNNHDLTQRTFHARVEVEDDELLRTGDLGFVSEGQLFVTGRAKDLIIIAGKNHYPQDIEDTASRCDPMFSGRPGAAFATQYDERESFALVQEVAKAPLQRCTPSERDQRLRALAAKARDAIAFEHGVLAQRIVLVPPGSLPLTTSGKIQRSLSRRFFDEGSFEDVWPTRNAGEKEDPS